MPRPGSLEANFEILPPDRILWNRFGLESDQELFRQRFVT